MLLAGGVTYTTVMVNDTLQVKAIIEMIGSTVGFENSITADTLHTLSNGIFFFNNFIYLFLFIF